MDCTEPLRFAPIYLPKVWGGRTLEDFVGPLDASGPVGEVWQLVDRDEASSVVVGGPLEGRSLRGLMLSEGPALLGKTRAAPGDYFPLLVKFLDARQNLSVQVHPDEKAATRIGGGAGAKTESWFILSAEPGSVLHLGLKPDVDASTFAARASTADVVDLVETYPVKAGQFVFVPPGTVHAIGAGITLIEIQENSDTTYRLYDWSREGLDGAPRELHTDNALRSIDYEQVLTGPVDPVFEDIGSNRVAHLCDCDRFKIDLLHVHEPTAGDTEGRALVYVIVSGSGTFSVPGQDAECRVSRAETWLVPACLGEHRFEAPDGDLQILRIETRV